LILYDEIDCQKIKCTQDETKHKFGTPPTPKPLSSTKINKFFNKRILPIIELSVKSGDQGARMPVSA
jgi:hypothetical protein